MAYFLVKHSIHLSEQAQKNNKNDIKIIIQLVTMKSIVDKG